MGVEGAGVLNASWSKCDKELCFFFLIKNQKTTSNACILFSSPVGLEVDFFLILPLKKEKRANTRRPWAASRWTAGR